VSADEAAAPPVQHARRWRYRSAVQVARALNAVGREPRDEAAAQPGASGVVIEHDKRGSEAISDRLNPS
jgi:hypothetical protein